MLQPSQAWQQVFFPPGTSSAIAVRHFDSQLHCCYSLAETRNAWGGLACDGLQLSSDDAVNFFSVVTGLTCIELVLSHCYCTISICSCTVLT